MANGEMKREDVKAWMIENLDELDKLLTEINAARENYLLKKRVEELEKEKNSQAMSYGRKVAKLEKERDEFKTKLGLPVEPKKTRKRPEADPPAAAAADGDAGHFAKPATLSERLAGKEKEK